MIFSAHRTKVGGHRGWPVRFPDNSAEGIQAAAEVADFVEIDVRLSRDGELVLAHDPSVGGLMVSETDFAELQRTAGVISLRQGMEAAGHTPLNLEVKGLALDPEEDRGVALKAAALARATDLVTGFWWPSIDAVRKEFPDVATGLLTDSDADAAIDHARAMGHRAVAIERRLVTSERIERTHGMGLRLIGWTVNDIEELKNLALAGVDAIITDDPGTAAAVLRGGTP